MIQIVKRQCLLVDLCLVLAWLCPLTLYGNHPIPIQQHDERAVRAVLIDEVSDLAINTVTLITAGWDNLVADINGEWIFRFPLLEEFIPILKREKLLLKHLENTVSMPIPHYQYIGMRTAFAGYRKIIGGSLNEELYLNLTVDVRQGIAESLALFLTQLHHAVSVEEALQWGYKEYHVPVQQIEQSLPGTLPSSEIERIISEALVYAKQNPCSANNLVLLHNDLHGENLAFDANMEQVTGVFDFSEAAIGDYSIEFGKLFCIHQDLATRTAEAYASLNDVANPIIPAAVDHILRRAVYILQARECCNASRESGLVQMLQDFIPIWDELKKETIQKEFQ